MLSYGFQVEMQDCLHVGRQFSEQHAKAPAVSQMSHQNSPQMYRSQNGFPGSLWHLTVNLIKIPDIIKKMDWQTWIGFLIPVEARM